MKTDLSFLNAYLNVIVCVCTVCHNKAPFRKNFCCSTDYTAVLGRLCKIYNPVYVQPGSPKCH